jgi:hypothetical protein
MMSSRRKIFRNFVSPGIINPGDKIPGRRPLNIRKFQNKNCREEFWASKTPEEEEEVEE